MNWWDAPHIQGFKWSFINFRAHSGIDLGMPYGTPISTPVNGTVLGADCFPWGGQVDILCRLEDGNRYVLSFLHLSQIAGQLGMHIGENITAGTVIGFSGGLSKQGVCRTGIRYSHDTPHLHFEQTIGVTAPYTNAHPAGGGGGCYDEAGVPFTPCTPIARAGANNNQHPVDPTDLLQATKDGDGIVSSEPVVKGSGGSGGPTPGQTSHSLLTSVPGFLGICEALDAIEQFEPFNPPNGTVGIGPVQVPNPLDNFGYAVAWTGRNVLVVVVRLAIMGAGWVLLLLLLWGLIAANRWLQEAGGLAVAAGMGAV